MTTIKLEVWKSPTDIVTVTTHTQAGGTRLCGIKLAGSGSKKVAEFFLRRQDIEALVEDFDQENAAPKGGGSGT